jgi:LEA14-like dessication related protein
VASTFPPLALLAALALMSPMAACAKPEPPVITPKETRVTAVDPLGVSFLARVEATNPNKFELATQGVTARIVLDNDVDLGTVTAPQAVTLPAGQTVLLDLPLAIKWSDLGVVGKLALANRPMPFRIEGHVKIGGEKLNVAVPFKVAGTISREQLAGAALRGLPGGIPGLPGLSPR